jgi:hypothetical protein
MKEPKLPPGYPLCSEAGAKLRSPVSAFFGKIAEGHAAVFLLFARRRSDNSNRVDQTCLVAA